MARCSRCWRDPEATTRIRDDVARSCHKNRDSPCLACQKLLQIERKIEETRRTLQQLLTEREELASAFNEHHDPFLNQLPVELVSHIFTLSRPYQPSLDIFGFDEFDENGNIRSVLTLGQVCRNWRSIAHGTPALWTVFGTTINASNCVSSLKLSLEWLEKSGELPLFVWLHSHEPTTSALLESTREFLASIAQHAHRWQVLELQFPMCMVPTFSSATAGKRFDQLEHLSLYISGGTSDEPSDPPRMLELTAAPLCLTLVDGWIDYVSIDWSRLTKFVGNWDAKFTIPDCVHLFTNAANLMLCRMEVVVAFGAESVVQNTPFEHRSLQTLQLGVCAALFWDHFNFPGLTTIRLDEGNDSLSWARLRTCLGRSQCKITDLLLVENEDEKEEEILETLILTPDVERLSLDGFKLACRLLYVIEFCSFDATKQSNIELLPQLEAVVCRSCGTYTEFDWSTLVAFIVGGRQKLQSVDILFEKPLSLNRQDVDVYRISFKKLLDATEGLELRLVDHEGADLLGRLRRHYGL